MMATCIVQPIDLIKTRMQLSGEGGGSRVHKSSLHAFINIAKQEGLYNLYTGLSAGLLRQATYGTTRFGVYSWLLDYFSSRQTTPGPLPFHWMLISGLTAGGLGAIVGTPAEVALIRMTSDGRLPPEQRRNYKHAGDALAQIAKKEGVINMWRGATPTVVRAMLLNACQLASYTKTKMMLLNTGFFSDGIILHFCASLCSGFLSTVVSMPVDITKTRIQTMKIVDGVPEYKGVVDVLMKTVAKEGFFSLWKGFTPYLLRLRPHTTFTFIFLEQMNAAYKRHVG